MDQDSSLAIGDTLSRLRLLERRQDSLRQKLLIINQNMLEEYKKLLFEIRSLSTEVNELKTALAATQDSIKAIVRDSESFAKTQQLKVLEKYINLLSPLHFVTEDELHAILKKRDKHGVRKKVSKRKHR